MAGDTTFDQFMRQRSEVALAYVNGDPAPLRSISTSRDPATFFGPAGGVEKGAEHVLSVNEAGSRNFHEGGTTSLEILHQGSDGDLAYWTGLQRATVRMGESEEPVDMTLRITEVFRREDGAWKLVHRHADGLAEKETRPQTKQEADRKDEQSADQSADGNADREARQGVDKKTKG